MTDHNLPAVSDITHPCITNWRYLGPLRVPACVTFLVLYLPAAALFSGVPGYALIHGLFDLYPLSNGGDLWWKAFLTFFFTFLALGSLVTALYQTGGIIHDYAPTRFGEDAFPREPNWLSARGWRKAANAGLISLPSLVAAMIVSFSGTDATTPYMAGLLGALSATALVYYMVLVAASLPERLTVIVRNRAEKVADRLQSRGFVERKGFGQKNDETFGHHMWAAFFTVITGFLWLAVLGWSIMPPAWLPGVRVPALCSLYLLLMLLTWILSYLTFLLDYYRVPVLTLIFVALCLIGKSYTFSVPDGALPLRARTPTEVVASRIGKPSGRVVVVSAAGGGIQAAAWTAQVLQGIASAAGKRRDEFLGRIVAVSGVSGGSVGLAPFILAMNEGRSDFISESLVDVASTSSLDRVAASWATVDSFPPLGFLGDRGRSLQKAWQESWSSARLESGTLLSDLIPRVNGEGMRSPGAMFNAVSLHTGEQVVIGTTVPAKSTTDGQGFQYFAVAGPKGKSLAYSPTVKLPDLDLATAARLSATFPFVSPAASCSNCEGLRRHLVDGGYLDTSGVTTLADWVAKLLKDSPPELSVIFVRIEPFAESNAQDDSAPRAPSQLLVPLRGLYNVRGAGQTRNATVYLDNLEDRFQDRICVRTFVFDPSIKNYNPPLSWHLTSTQKDKIRHAWEPQKDLAREVVEKALAPELECE